jgi:hypothetical protein
MSGLIKHIISGAIKRFEVFEGFFKYSPDNIDFITRVDAIDIEDITFCHTLHNFIHDRWEIDTVLFQHIERKKRLLVSEEGGGRNEMKYVLKEQIEEEDKSGKDNFDRLRGVS